MSAALKAQQDSIYLQRSGFQCVITEITPSFLYYKLQPQSPTTFSIRISKIRGYRLAGSAAVMTSARQRRADPLHDRRDFSLSTNPFSWINNYFSVTCEQSISRPLSVEFEGGYITGKTMLGQDQADLYFISYTFDDLSGYFVRPSLKWRYISAAGMRIKNVYYLRLDYSLNNIFYKNLSFSQFQNFETYDISLSCRAVLINAGYQLWAAKGFMLDLYLGLGYSDLDVKLEFNGTSSNRPGLLQDPEVFKASYQRFRNFRRISPEGLSYALGVKLGWRFLNR